MMLVIKNAVAMFFRRDPGAAPLQEGDIRLLDFMDAQYYGAIGEDPCRADALLHHDCSNFAKSLDALGHASSCVTPVPLLK